MFISRELVMQETSVSTEPPLPASAWQAALFESWTLRSKKQTKQTHAPLPPSESPQGSSAATSSFLWAMKTLLVGVAPPPPLLLVTIAASGETATGVWKKLCWGRLRPVGVARGCRTHSRTQPVNGGGLTIESVLPLLAKKCHCTQHALY